MNRLQDLDRWITIEPIGSGGQGDIFKVQPADSKNDPEKEIAQIVKKLLNPDHPRDLEEPMIADLLSAMKRWKNSGDSGQFKAMKVLKRPDNPADIKRMRNEIQAMKRISHPSIVRIVDSSSDAEDELWFVCDYFPRKLTDLLQEFRGDIRKSLDSFRPIVDAVAEIHKLGMVHRDIKPDNVFVDANGKLYLGDFGLIFSEERSGRITETFENVGSRDYMPIWAHGMRVNDVNASFDIFSLGKLLWSMVSGLPKFTMWYKYYPDTDIVKMFPDDSYMQYADEIFSKCIVEKERHCLKNASELLELVDKIRQKVLLNCEPLSVRGRRKCRVCGTGTYVVALDQDAEAAANHWGLSRSIKWRIFRCESCGHLQWFDVESKREAWKKETGVFGFGKKGRA